MDVQLIKDIAFIAGFFIALGTLVKAVLEYKKQSDVRRMECYLNLRDKFRSGEEMASLFSALEDRAPSLKDIPRRQKRNFIGFYEDLLLLMNSGVLKPHVAHYMFGYYALRCWESDSFWEGLNRNSDYWSLFRCFVDKMNLMEKQLGSNLKNISTYKI